MSDEFLFDFLNTPPEDEVTEIPSSEGFVPSGLTARWTIGRYFGTYTEEDLASPDWEVNFDHRTKTSTGKYFYLFDNDEKAQVAQDALGLNFMNQYWIMASPTDGIINLPDDAKDNFGTEVVLNTTIKSLAALNYKSYSWEFQLCALPCAVSAAARAEGQDVPEIDLTPLLNLQAEMDYSEQIALIGDKEQGYEESFYWLQRKALWAALGENDPKLSAARGATTSKGKPHPLAVTSEKLNRYLTIARLRSFETWGTILRVPDAREDATYMSANGQLRRTTFNVITQIFPNKEAAVASLGDDFAVEDTSGKPPIPTAWKEMPGDWDDQVSNIAQAVKDGTPLPLAYKQAGGEKLQATQEEVSQWVDFLIK